MRPVSCATRHIFLVFTVYGAVGATIAAATDADAPTKVRTLSTKPQSPEEHHDATLSPELPATHSTDTTIGSNPGSHVVVHTAPSTADDPLRVRTIRIGPQSAPQSRIDVSKDQAEPPSSLKAHQE